MMNTIIHALLFAVLFGGSPIVAQDVPPQDEIKRIPHITAMQAYILSRQKQMILLDVHDGSDRSKIVGAYYIPSKKIKDVTLKIPKNQVIGVFCD